MPKILEGEEADAEFGHLAYRDPEEMRRQSEEAFKRLQAYIEEHRQSSFLALDIFTGLFNQLGRDD